MKNTNFETKMGATGKDKVIEPCNLVRAKYHHRPSIFAIEGFPTAIDEISSDPDGPPEENPKKPQELNWKRFIGLGFALLACGVFPLGSVVIKTIQSNHPYHPLAISSWRALGILIPSLVVIVYHCACGNRKEVTKCIWPLTDKSARKNVVFLVIRGTISSMGILGMVSALQFLNIADVTTILFSTPVFVGFLAHCFLGEKLGIVSVLASLMVLVGVGIITRPPFLTGGELSVETMMGMGLALATMTCWSTVTIMLRYVRAVATSVTTASFGAIAFSICTLIGYGLGVFEIPNGKEDWLLAIALGVITFAGQTLFVLSLQYEEAGPVTLMRGGDVVFAFIWQYLFLGTMPDVFSVVGAAVIMSSVLVIIIRKLIFTLPLDSPTRKRFWFLLL